MLEMNGVREYCEGESVSIGRKNGRIVIEAVNEGGFTCTHTDLEDVLKYVSKALPQVYLKYTPENADLVHQKEVFRVTEARKSGITKKLYKMYSTEQSATKCVKDLDREDGEGLSNYKSPYKVVKSTLEDELTPNKRFGVFIGRFQPLHKGHKAIIDEIILGGYTPIIVVGSAQEAGTEKNPYSYSVRRRMIKSIYHKRVIVVPLEDSLEDMESWLKRLDNLVKSVVGDKEYVYFTHNKETERGKYVSLKDSEYASDKINHEKIDLSDFMDVKISATDIRNDPVGNKGKVPNEVWRIMADPKYYKDYLKESQ